MLFRFIAFFTLMFSVALSTAGEKRGGKAVAELLSMSETVNPGQTIWVAFRLKADRGWHTYWTNPGEGGMPTSVEWKLPKGWSATPLAFPAPHRFKSMGMNNIGYEEEIYLFSQVTVPADSAVGPVQLAGKLGWLTCDDEACIPGEVELLLPLEVTKAAPRASEQAETLTEKLNQMPLAVDWNGGVTIDGDNLLFTIVLPEGTELGKADLLATQEGICGHGLPTWVRQDNKVTATVAKSEFFEELPKEFKVLLMGGKLKRPLIVTVK